jgi:hypothetical protein
MGPIMDMLAPVFLEFGVGSEAFKDKLLPGINFCIGKILRIIF